jgi:ABC-type lipoprotein export system ATPase subunit
MADLMLDATGIHYSYREGAVVTPVLHGIDLRVQRGEFVVISGPSGCGKSTLLHVVGLMARPGRARELSIDGQRALGLPDAARTRLRRCKIGFVFQRFNLLGVISAKENINLALRLRGHSLNGQAEQALEAVGLSDLGAKKPGEMSIGRPGPGLSAAAPAGRRADRQPRLGQLVASSRFAQATSAPARPDHRHDHA